MAIFPIFLGFVGISWGSPTILLADFGAILAIFDHFWAIFGPFLGRFFFPFLTENPETPQSMLGTRLRYKDFPYACYPRGGGCYRISRTRARAHASLFLGLFGILGQKKPIFFRPQNGPKMAQKWSKMAKIAPKSANKIVGVPQEIPTNPKNIGKMAKNAPTVQNENAPKRVKNG